jgi:hypothetical protein
LLWLAAASPAVAAQMSRQHHIEIIFELLPSRLFTTTARIAYPRLWQTSMSLLRSLSFVAVLLLTSAARALSPEGRLCATFFQYFGRLGVASLTRIQI